MGPFFQHKGRTENVYALCETIWLFQTLSTLYTVLTYSTQVKVSQHDPAPLCSELEISGQQQHHHDQLA